MSWSRVLAATLVLNAGSAPGVELTNNLAKDAQAAQSDCKPLLLEFSANSCSYCQLLEEEVLNPTLLNRSYDQRVLMRKLVIDEQTSVTDFDGSGKVSPGQLASRYKVFVTPTLVFVDSHGTELAERMVGVTTLEFYGGYLDAALDKAKAVLRERHVCDE